MYALNSAAPTKVPSMSDYNNTLRAGITVTSCTRGGNNELDPVGSKIGFGAFGDLVTLEKLYKGKHSVFYLPCRCNER